MPELPEVETIVRTLAPQVDGARIGAISVLHDNSLQIQDIPAFEAVIGSTVASIRRRGKLILVYLRPEAQARLIVMAFHLKMTGSFFVHPAGARPLKHTRIIFDLEPAQGSRLRLFFDDIRTFGYCRIQWEESLPKWDFLRRLGPEPLDISAGSIAERLASRSGQIKALLLNQEVIAGIGNIYADEALFRAGIHPAAKASSLSLHRLESLGTAVQDVLRQSIEECGSSIRNYRDANGNAGAFQNHFFVYGRKEQTCLVCHGPLETVKIAGRTTVLCPHCQPSSLPVA